MSSSNELFQVGELLDSLRRDVGNSDFGYRVQGLFAHVLMHKGGRIIEPKPQGHPDIKAELRTKRMLFQIKAVYAKTIRQSFTASNEDLEGIKPIHKSETGYMAVLECVAPITWILLEYPRICQQKFPLNMATLRALADRPLSIECTEEFVELVIRNQLRLRNLSFHILRSRALRGESL